MTYKINTTNGNLLAEVPDGLLDTNSCSLTLIGKNSVNFGESVNENFVKLLENFASSSQPRRALRGQIWYDTTNGRLNVFDGNNFRTTGNPVVLPTQPQSALAGDLWIDTGNQQLKFYDGLSWRIAGPEYTTAQGISGFKIISVLDDLGRSQTLAALYVGNSILGYFSKETFQIGFDLAEFGPTGSTINIGFNVSTYPGVKFNVTTTRAESIVLNDEVKPATSILYTDEDNTISGDVGSEFTALSITKDDALKLGSGNQIHQYISSTDFIIENTFNNNDILIKVKHDLETKDAISIRAVANIDTLRVGILTDDPQHPLDVNGSVRITGNLLVEGDTTFLDVLDLKVEDIHIELASTSTGTVLLDALVNGGGLILKADPTDHTMTYSSTNVSWDFSENVNIIAGKEYRIDNQSVLNTTTLGETVAISEGLEELRKILLYLNVDSININDNVISNTVTNENLVLETAGTGVISVSGTRVVDLDDPVEDDNATNKGYVDTLIYTKPLALTLDVTGIISENYVEDDIGDSTTPDSLNIRVASQLDGLLPYFHPVDAPTGAVENSGIVRVLCHAQRVTNGQVFVNTDDINKDTAAVLSVDGSTIESIISDFAIDPLTPPTTTITTLRQLKIFTMVNGNWQFTSNIGDTTSTVAGLGLNNEPWWPSFNDLL